MKHIADMRQPFITDVLLWKLIDVFYRHKLVYKQRTMTRQLPTKCPSGLNTTHLVELLQKSAVEHLTIFRKIEARDFGSIVKVVTTDFEALYAYKCGDYQRCLQLSTQNVHTLRYAKRVATVLTYPQFIQLLDNNIVSLTALTLIVNPKCRDDSRYVRISQLTLSLYLMTQCQLKLRHSVTSLAKTFDYIKVAHRKPANRILDRLVLKLIARKAVTYITTKTQQCDSCCPWKLYYLVLEFWTSQYQALNYD